MLNCAATGKINHATRWAARRHLKAMRHDGLSVDRMNVYRCKACGGFDIGYNAITAGDRIDEILRRHQARIKP